MSSGFGILGPLVAKIDGRSVDLGSPKQRALLALLLMHANRVVRSERILDALWGDDAEGKENALWVYVSRLRTLFEPDRTERGESSVLLTRDHGYVLSVDPASIDAVQFEREATEGRKLIKDDPQAASDLLGRALKRWRGSALQGFVYEEFAQPEITRLEELRLTAIEDRIEADLGLGKSGELVGELEALRQAQPLRERLVAQLMLALYRSGRQADALRTFERFRRYLDDELGIEPSAELRRLEEQVLLHDSRVQARGRTAHSPDVFVAESVVNPFRGLRAFGEDDASVFFGRERLVADVLRRITGGTRLVALVGPSGSGKSSVVRAGVIPAIRKGDLSGEQTWMVAQMVPGSHPFAELEVALLRASLDAPDSLREQLAAPETGMLRASLMLLPDVDSRLLLVIDQFEELFTLVEDEEVRRRFLAQLVPLLDDPHRRIVVVVTLRSDFYSQPLAYPEFGARLGDGVINTVPLLPDELESAAQQPAAQVNVSLQPALLSVLLADVAGQPGALPLFQFALTELFDRRTDDTLTLDTYREMGRIEGAVTRRAEDLYRALDEVQEAAVKQLFLRLVTIADGNFLGRRRVSASEIITLDVDIVALQGVIDLYTQHRLLTLDRDQVTGSPTVEVAHEALLNEWERLRGWIEEANEDIRRHGTLRSAMAEWDEAEQDPDYLLGGARLQGYERWASGAIMQLSADERAYLEASVRARARIEAVEAERLATKAQLATAAKRRLWALGAVLAVVIATAVAAVLVALGPEPPRVAVVMTSVSEELEGLLQTGIDRAERELGVRVEQLTGRFTSLERQYRELAEGGVDLLFIDQDNSGWPWVDQVIADHPETAFAVINGILAPDGARTVYFADEEAGYLAGAAAALTTDTGVIGFVGSSQISSNQSDTSERWRAGYEAGAHAVNSEVEVVATYIGTGSGAFRDVAGGKAAADQLYQRNADVVLAFAGDATLGVIEAAWEQTRDTGTQRWVIGSDSDWSIAVPTHLRSHVLTSAVKQWDTALFETIRTFAEGDFAPGISVLGLADGAVGLTPSAHFTDQLTTMIDELSVDIKAGLGSIPRAPIGELLPPPGIEVSQTVTMTWDGENCSYAGSATAFGSDTTVRIDFVNSTSVYREFFALHSQRGVEVSTLVQPMARNTGYITLHLGNVELNCGSETRDRSRAVVYADTVTAVTLTVGP